MTALRRSPMPPRQVPLRRSRIEARRARVYDEEWYIANAAKRFAKSVREGAIPEHRPDLGPCLLFTGATNSSGYGQFRYNQRNGYAHRYAWEVGNGPIPEGLTIDHLCRVRICVRISHLEVVDGVTNYFRGLDLVTHCRNGHLLDPDNVRLSPGVHRDHRKCRICIRDAWQRSAAKRSRTANGLPNRKIRFDQAQVRAAIAEIRAGLIGINEAARRIGCNGNYLGRRTWQTVRREVLRRDSGRCLRCGAVATDVHHRIRRGMGGARDPQIAYGASNLISLCRVCHDAAEARQPDLRAEGYWLESWQVPAVEPVMICGEQGGAMVWLTGDFRYVAEGFA